MRIGNSGMWEQVCRLDLEHIGTERAQIWPAWSTPTRNHYTAHSLCSFNSMPCPTPNLSPPSSPCSVKGTSRIALSNVPPMPPAPLWWTLHPAHQTPNTGIRWPYLGVWLEIGRVDLMLLESILLFMLLSVCCPVLVLLRKGRGPAIEWKPHPHSPRCRSYMYPRSSMTRAPPLLPVPIKHT